MLWVISLINYCCKISGLPYTKSLMARSWLNWGEKVETPVTGDIVVFWRGNPQSVSGHVGIYISQNDMESCVMCCDQILKCLDLPRNITINNLSDLSKIYINIGNTLIKQRNKTLSNFSLDIAELLDSITTGSERLQQDVVTVHGSTVKFRNSEYKFQNKSEVR